MTPRERARRAYGGRPVPVPAPPTTGRPLPWSSLIRRWGYGWKQVITKAAARDALGLPPDEPVVAWRDPAMPFVADVSAYRRPVDLTVRRGSPGSGIDAALATSFAWASRERGGSWPPSRPPAGPLRDVVLDESQRYSDTGRLDPWDEAP